MSLRAHSITKVVELAVEPRSVQQIPRLKSKYAIRDAILSPKLKTKGMGRFLRQIGVHRNLSCVYDALMEVCAKRGHILHAAHESCAMFYNAPLEVIESVVTSHNVVGNVFQELIHQLESPDDHVLFDEDSLDRIFKFLFKLWTCIKIYVPEIRVPDSMTFHELFRHRREAQEKLLCVI